MKIKISFIAFVLIALLFSFNTVVWAESKITEGKVTEKAESKIPEGKETEIPESKTSEDKITIVNPLPIVDNKVKIINKVFTLPTVEKMEINQALTVNNLGLENKSASFFYLNKDLVGTFNPQDYLNIKNVIPEGTIDDFIIVTLHLADKDYTPKYFKAFVENLEQEVKKEKQTIAEKTETYIITYNDNRKIQDYFLFTNSVSLINGALLEVNKMHLMEYDINNVAEKNQEEDMKIALEKHVNFLKQLEDLNKN